MEKAPKLEVTPETLLPANFAEEDLSDLSEGEEEKFYLNPLNKKCVHVKYLSTAL